MLGNDNELTPEAQAVVEKVEKLLRLAERNTNEHERAAAVAKGMDLLAAYNLDMEAVKQNTGQGGKRIDESLKGGHLQFQRDLWRAVAKLNFCMYWSQVVPVRVKSWAPNKTNTGFVRVWSEKNTRQHRIVGKLVNARSTKVMAEYLEQAIDRAMRERCEERNEQFRGKWANSFREGAADRIIEKIRDRRAELLAEEARKAADAAAKAEADLHARTREGVSTGREITLAGLDQREREANLDFLYGEGWCARQAKAQAERQQRMAAYEAEVDARLAKWREENPEEARLEDELKRKRDEDRRKREARNAARRERYWRDHGQYNNGGYRQAAYKGDLGAYYSGRDAAEKISIDLQAEGRKSAGALS